MIFISHLIFQAGDGYLAGLAARFASELNVDEDDVLHQLEDLRSAATSGFATSTQHHQRTRRMSEETSSSPHHNYANFPGSSNLEDKNYMPGIYAVSWETFGSRVISTVSYSAVHTKSRLYEYLADRPPSSRISPLESFSNGLLTSVEIYAKLRRSESKLVKIQSLGLAIFCPPKCMK